MLAEDLMHDAFLRAVGRLAHMRDPGAFGAYLRRAVVNQARMHFRRQGVERAHLRRESSARRDSPSSTLYDVETRDVLRHALLSLPIRQRMAVALRFYEDLSDAQAAEIMRCRPGTVRSLVSRALSTLRAATVEGNDDA
jgi:RNA polymerase sigma factor (sigma-70 family)